MIEIVGGRERPTQPVWHSCKVTVRFPLVESSLIGAHVMFPGAAFVDILGVPPYFEAGSGCNR